MRIFGKFIRKLFRKIQKAAMENRMEKFQALKFYYKKFYICNMIPQNFDNLFVGVKL